MLHILAFDCFCHCIRWPFFPIKLQTKNWILSFSIVMSRAVKKPVTRKRKATMVQAEAVKVDPIGMAILICFILKFVQKRVRFIRCKVQRSIWIHHDLKIIRSCGAWSVLDFIHLYGKLMTNFVSDWNLVEFTISKSSIVRADHLSGSMNSSVIRHSIVSSFLLNMLIYWRNMLPKGLVCNSQ